MMKQGKIPGRAAPGPRLRPPQKKEDKFSGIDLVSNTEEDEKLPEKKEFSGKVAVVTGAASGIGLATASRFAQAGMKVVMADIQEDALEDAVKSLGNMGHEVLGVPTDVSKWDAIQALAEKTMAEFGAVNVVHTV